MIHASLSPEQNQIIEHDLRYSDNDLTALDKLQSVAFGGSPLRIPEADKWMFTTVRGIVAQIKEIAAQIEQFHADAGLIYWIAIQKGRCEIKKTVVFTSPWPIDSPRVGVVGKYRYGKWSQAMDAAVGSATIRQRRVQELLDDAF
jgi:hypothetical protein